MKQTQGFGNRLKLKSDFDYIKENGRKYTCVYFMALISPGMDELDSKCGVICSRKFDKRAVKRNRCRRILFEAFRLLLKEGIFPCRTILIPRRQILTVKMDVVKEQMNLMFMRLRLKKDISPKSDSPSLSPESCLSSCGAINK